MPFSPRFWGDSVPYSKTDYWEKSGTLILASLLEDLGTERVRHRRLDDVRTTPSDTPRQQGTWLGLEAVREGFRRVGARRGLEVDPCGLFFWGLPERTKMNKKEEKQDKRWCTQFSESTHKIRIPDDQLAQMRRGDQASLRAIRANHILTASIAT